MTQFTDCLIIGGGQAGLAMSHCLRAQGIEHVVLERGRVANRWTAARWPTLRLLTPGWMTRLPGRQLAQASEGFLKAAELAARLQSYAREEALPVIENVDVLALERLGAGFRAVTSRGSWVARSVVVATGACDRQRIPGWRHKLAPSLHQIASTRYRTPQDLPEGGVLVVGGSATGIQLADELARAGRRVILASGSHVRTPRRYRGRDLFEWLDASGFLTEAAPAHRDAARLMAQPSLQLVGDRANRDIDLYRLASRGVTVTGRALDAQGSVVGFGSDLPQMLDLAEKRRATLLDRIDRHIAQHSPATPVDPAARAAPPLLAPFSGAIDLKAHGIGTVLWASGYRRDYSWMHFDACDERGELRQHGGIGAVPGLYAIGLPFMRHRASSFIDGVGRDAAAIAPVIAARLGASDTRQAA